MKLNLLEQIAFETLAKSLFDDYNRGIGELYKWNTIKEETRNEWRHVASKLLNESYYAE